MSILKKLSRYYTVHVGKEPVLLRRPKREDGDLEPILDLQQESIDERGLDDRSKLENATAEKLAAACIMVCFREEEGGDQVASLEQATELMYSASVLDGVPPLSTELTAAAMSLCGVGGTRLLPGKAALQSSSAATST